MSGDGARVAGGTGPDSGTVRFAVVTGATGGIGSAICAALADSGHAVLAHYGSREERARELQQKLRDRGARCHLIGADLGDPAGVDAVVRHVGALLEEHPEYRLTALVNNAAKMLSPSFADTTPADFDRYFAINTRAPFFLAQGLVPLMPPGGSVVNMSSASAHFSSPGDISYAMSKAAVESLTRNMAEAIASRGIRVNAVIPGFTDNGHPGFRSAAVREYMASFAVLGGVSEPETVAAAVAFLASDAAKRTTGTTLDVSGGSTLSARGARKHSVKELLAEDQEEV
ncbi:SDR family NAD(P)-dependent oxidoreductase [Leucobacter massiliensis]|uniref:Ketoreductase domain-containing protein n=1 Tax=Leucobacter massiliensis TaxID=1686285 RepID=A0A2S9QNR4_9MICO|nr:SDR family oxidoreductase [Leucobacter massiliensis]PRI11226.1 hypothetical protein B4915_10275 [Leucobacter massiliensis]